MRAMLRAAEREWEWIDRAPVIKSEPEPKGRVAFLTREQAEVLIATLPEKYRNPVRFALLTGLRRSNVFGLNWENVDLERGTATVQADEAKAGKRIVVPLSSQARALLASLPTPHEGRVWGDLTRVWCNSWKSAVQRAGLPPSFRFHDLRHTWASWHAMAGTRREVLQELGGWASHEMVERYAHLSPEYLSQAAENVGF
jgi:integrase